MIREWGSPTLFLTFSCAEYESPDITEFLMKVNNVPPSYNIGKPECSKVTSFLDQITQSMHPMCC